MFYVTIFTSEVRVPCTKHVSVTHFLRCCRPNAGFVGQLSLFEQMGKKVDGNNELFRRYELQRLTDCILNRGTPYHVFLSVLKWKQRQNARNDGPWDLIEHTHRFWVSKSVRNWEPTKVTLIAKNMISRRPPSSTLNWRHLGCATGIFPRCCR